MKLITKAIEKSLPALYANESKQPHEIKVIFKLFNPTGSGTWYITEGDLATGELFGLCRIHEAELGYVDFTELKSFRGRFGLGIERDLSWSGTLADAMQAEGYPYTAYVGNDLPRQEEQIATAVEHVLAADMPA